jgi:ATP-dependent Lhr-like helicase
MNELVLLFCVACRRYEVLTRVKNANLSCPHCGSGLIAALKPGEKDNIRIFRKGKDEKCIRRIHRNARLVLSYGIPAVIALSARGVGPTQASKILMRKREEFYEGILEAERRYFLFRRFWR